jgi:hypothetical protein
MLSFTRLYTGLTQFILFHSVSPWTRTLFYISARHPLSSSGKNSLRGTAMAAAGPVDEGFWAVCWGTSSRDQPSDVVGFSLKACVTRVPGFTHNFHDFKKAVGVENSHRQVTTEYSLKYYPILFAYNYLAASQISLCIVCLSSVVLWQCAASSGNVVNR